MWLLRRKATVPAVEAELLPPATTPVRRIEITVDRHWIVRAAGTGPDNAIDVEPAGSTGTEARLEKPPDG